MGQDRARPAALQKNSHLGHPWTGWAEQWLEGEASPPAQFLHPTGFYMVLYILFGGQVLLPTLVWCSASPSVSEGTASLLPCQPLLRCGRYYVDVFFPVQNTLMSGGGLPRDPLEDPRYRTEAGTWMPLNWGPVSRPGLPHQSQGQWPYLLPISTLDGRES